MILKNEYSLMAIALFLMFVGHGMGSIIITQNRTALELQWNNSAFFGTVLAAIGWGRLGMFTVSGKLSDILGRKFFVVVGSLVYIVGLIGMAFATTLASAIVFSAMFGVANSCLDVGIYPALIEAFPKEAKKVNTALVIFLRIAQLILPLAMLGVFSATGLGVNFRISFFMVAMVFTLALILVLLARFPDHKAIERQAQKQLASSRTKGGIRSLFTPEGLAFVVYGFISISTFMIMQKFSNRFGEVVLNMDPDIANVIPTFFAIGSIIGVMTAIVAQQKFKAVDVMVVLTAFSLAVTVFFRLTSSVLTLIIGTALIGFSAAGGVLQMGVTLMMEMIPLGKGVVSGIFLSMSSVASIVVPLVITAIEASHHLNVMLFNAGVAAVGLLCAIVINVRFKAIEKSSNKTVKSSIA